jgi:uncharacterized membrane protein
MMGSYEWMGTSGGFGMLLPLLVWLGVVVLLVWGIGSLFGSRTTDTQTDALEILKRRFAAGEIASAEFEIARRALIGPTGSPQMKGTN